MQHFLNDSSLHFYYKVLKCLASYYEPYCIKHVAQIVSGKRGNTTSFPGLLGNEERGWERGTKLVETLSSASKPAETKFNAILDVIAV